MGTIFYTKVTGEQDYYKVKFLLLNPKALKEQYRTKKYQLVLCCGGFGCNPDNTSKSVFVSFLDGDRSKYSRDLILGEPTEEVVKEWLSNYRNEITSLSFLEEV